MRTVLCLIPLAVLTLGGPMSATLALAEPPNEKSAAEWLDVFVQGWDNTKWEKPFRTSPAGHMWPLDEDDWKVRFQALQGVVRQGKDSVPILLEALTHQDESRRIFAAQALRYLAPDVPTPSLLTAATKDPDPAVRLYAVDALGMKGDTTVDFAALKKNETNRDVLMHINYAIERDGKPIEASVIKQLTEWDPVTIGSAVVGKPAPDFELRSANGDPVKLSDFKGKSAVVLVFVYGDT